MALRDKKKCLASDAAAYTHYAHYVECIQERRQKIPELGNLVLVKNHG